MEKKGPFFYWLKLKCERVILLPKKEPETQTIAIKVHRQKEVETEGRSISKSSCRSEPFFVHVFVWVCVRVYGGQRPTLAVFRDQFPPHPPF